MEKITQKITPNLWFAGQAEEAVTFYVSIFKDARIGRVMRYRKVGQEKHGMAEGSVMTIEFQLGGQNFLALNGPSIYPFTEAVSFIINCDSQEEVDYYWDRLTEGGDERAQICGWLKDKFGVSWQVVPSLLDEMLMDPDPEKVERVTAALLNMKKLDLQALAKAYNA